MDHLTKAGRSKVMSSIRSQNTRPELEVRKFLHAQGYRFRLHAARLPGKPDSPDPVQVGNLDSRLLLAFTSL